MYEYTRRKNCSRRKGECYFYYVPIVNFSILYDSIALVLWTINKSGHAQFHLDLDFTFINI